MKKIILILFLFCSSISIIYSQPSITWQRTYSNHLSYPETFGADVCPDGYGNFYIVSNNWYPTSFNIIKINAYGDTIWLRTVDSVDNTYCGCVAAGDGGVVCSGDGTFTVKYDKDGNRIWKKIYSYANLSYKIMKTFDGNYVICGQYGGWYGLIYKVDSNGNLIWQRNYNLNYYIGWYNYIIESHDNNYIAVGFRTKAENDTSKGLITKIDTSGNLIWEKEYVLYNIGTGLVNIDKINLEYLISGSTADSLNSGMAVVYFIKIDELGNIKFSKKFESENNWNYYSTDIKKINENRYLFCSNGYNLGQDTIITKIFITDSTGNVIHSKKLNDRDYVKLNRAYIINNGDIILAGSCDYISPNYASTLVVRMDSNLYVPPIGIKKIGKELPHNFSLSQNYPNPFNPTTKIKFNLPHPSEGGAQAVKIVVFDLLGREVATLVNEQLKPGTYEVEWNGSNFASGVYFYKLTTESFSNTKRMVLIK